MRRSRHHTLKTQGLGQIVDAVSIGERPASVEDRAVPGHWEGDLVFGSHNSQIATLVERQTRYVMLVKLNGKDSKTVVNALIKHSHKLPQELYKSLTWDRGTEMHAHKKFTLATDIKVYFCDRQRPWLGQRGNLTTRDVRLRRDRSWRRHNFRDGCGRVAWAVALDPWTAQRLPRMLAWNDWTD